MLARKKLKTPKRTVRQMPDVRPDQNPITARQQDVLDAMVIRFRNDYRPASVREMMDDLGISSPNGVMCHLHALVKKGHLLELPDRSSRRFIPASIKTHIDGLI